MSQHNPSIWYEKVLQNFLYNSFINITLKKENTETNKFVT